MSARPEPDRADYAPCACARAQAEGVEVCGGCEEHQAARAEAVGATVALIMTAGGRVASVWRDQAAAAELVARYNADPFVAGGEPDPDAPYSVQTWAVMAARG